MAEPAQIKRYQISARFEDGAVIWAFELEVGGKKIALDVRDGAQIPILLDICRRDWTVFFDEQTRTLTTGWSLPGSKSEM